MVLVWLLDLPGQVATLWHSQLMLCEPDFESEAESRFVQTHGAGVFEVGMSVDESGGQAALVGYVSWESGLDTRLASCTVWLYFYEKRISTREKNVKKKTYTGN